MTNRSRAATTLLVLLALVLTPAPASAAALTCSSEHAARILERHGVKYPARYRVSAGMHKERGKRYCSVAAWDDTGKPGSKHYNAMVSRNGKKLFGTAVERTTKKAWTRQETYTRAGRSHFGIKTATRSQRTSTTRVKAGQNVRQKTTFRNANGATGSRVLRSKERRTTTTNKVTIVLTTAKKKRTRITVDEKVTFAAKVTARGTVASNRKKFRGSYHVTLRERRHQGLLVSDGSAATGSGKAAYDRIFKLENNRFEAQRNGYLRGLS